MSPAASPPPVRSRDVDPAPGQPAPRPVVRVITLARADKKNAMTPPMLADLKSAIDDAARAAQSSSPRSVGAVVLEGEGAAFCAGFDLTLCKETSDAIRDNLLGLSAVIRSMRACPAPIVIAAHGAALAGGCALLCAADMVVTHHDAKLGYPVVRLGISPAISAPFLNAAVGFGRARERLLSTHLISGWDACRMGLAHECIEDAGKVRDRALALAHTLAAKPAPAMHATKRWLAEIDAAASTRDVDSALAASLALVGSPEERARLEELWKA